MKKNHKKSKFEIAKKSAKQADWKDTFNSAWFWQKEDTSTSTQRTLHRKASNTPGIWRTSVPAFQCECLFSSLLSQRAISYPYSLLAVKIGWSNYFFFYRWLWWTCVEERTKDGFLEVFSCESVDICLLLICRYCGFRSKVMLHSHFYLISWNTFFLRDF